jgi:hypothetical protein
MRREYHAQRTVARALAAQPLPAAIASAIDALSASYAGKADADTDKAKRAAMRARKFAASLARYGWIERYADTVAVNDADVTALCDLARVTSRRARAATISKAYHALWTVKGNAYALAVAARCKGFASSSGEMVRGWLLPLREIAASFADLARVQRGGALVVCRTKRNRLTYADTRPEMRPAPVALPAPASIGRVRTARVIVPARAAIEAMRAAYAAAKYQAYRDTQHRTHAAAQAANIYTEFRRMRARRMMRTMGNSESIRHTVRPDSCDLDVTRDAGNVARSRA